MEAVAAAADLDGDGVDDDLEDDLVVDVLVDVGVDEPRRCLGYFAMESYSFRGEIFVQKYSRSTILLSWEFRWVTGSPMARVVESQMPC